MAPHFLLRLADQINVEFAALWPIVCLLSATLFAQSNQKTDAQRADLAGPVKIVKTEKTIKSAESKGIEDKFPVLSNDKTTVYNRAGNIEEDVFSGEGGEVKLKFHPASREIKQERRST